MYCTIADFNKIQEDLIELIPFGDGFDESALDGLILAASEEVDNYLRSQYSTPLDSIPTTINRFCYHITRYYLYSDYAQVIPEEIEKAYNNTKSSLKDISQGRSQLAGLNNDKPVEQADTVIVKSASVFDVGYFD